MSVIWRKMNLKAFRKNINEQKYAINYTAYEKASFTDVVASYFNILKCGKNLLTYLTLRMNEHAWPIQEKNTPRRCWKP